MDEGGEISGADDYGLKCCITKRLPGDGFIGGPVHRSVGRSFLEIFKKIFIYVICGSRDKADPSFSPNKEEGKGPGGFLLIVLLQKLNALHEVALAILELGLLIEFKGQVVDLVLGKQSKDDIEGQFILL